jgi:sugar phosphate isomerase/epimerase
MAVVIGRREFVAALGALPVAAKPRVSVGAHIWVYAAKMPQYNPAPIIDEIFADLSGANLDFVELMHQVLLEDISFKKLPELSKRYNLPVIGSSWSANMWNRDEHAAIVQQGRTLIERVAAVKGRVIGVSVGDARRKKTPQELDAQAELLRQLNMIAADHGVVLNLHNHVYEVANDEHDLRGTLARLPDAKLGPDIGWLVRAKIDPVDFIRRHSARVVYFHLRNEKADGTWPENLTEGVIDFAAIGKLLHTIGFSGDLAIELAHERAFQPSRRNGENIRMSREYVKRVMKY